MSKAPTTRNQIHHINQEHTMTITFQTALNPFAQSTPPVTFDAQTKPAEAKLSSPLPSAFADAQRKLMDDALQRGDVRAYQLAKRSLRSHYRYHAMQTRDASKFPISHDDHLAATQHQHGYHVRGDVERMTVGIAEVPEWRPPLLRKMDASAGIEPVAHYVPGFGTTIDWLSFAQRDQIHPNRDRDELASDFTLSGIALAEQYGMTIEEYERAYENGLRAKTTRNLPGCD